MSDVILVLGVSHHTATLATRELVALAENDMRTVLRGLAGDARVREAVVVSTCNRTELYAVARTPADGQAALLEVLQRHSVAGAAALASAGYLLDDDRAAEHLFRVAAGLESAVLGESEIVGQLRAAVALSAEAGMRGRLLGGAFDQALAAGRKVRRRTAIARGSTSLAAVVARAAIANQQHRGVLVIGAGAVARSVAGTLSGLGARRLMIANRSEAAARALADTHGAEALPLRALDRALPRADVVVAATGAPRAILTAGRLAAVASDSRPRAVFDLAVPRNVEPAVATVPGVALHDIEQILATLELNRAVRRADVARAGAMVRDEADRFAAWRDALTVAPAVRTVWRRAEEIRQAELAACGPLDPAELERLDRVTAALVRKLLDGPTKRLRAAGAGSRLEAFRELFDVDVAPALRLVEWDDKAGAA
jgi:glutamyl-tRNA reductase